MLAALWEYCELDETFSFTIYNLQISLLKFIEGYGIATCCLFFACHSTNCYLGCFTV
uniref:BMA-DPM-3 n=1 Tax=Brugia malayi TaxID=6279 RepID=A0A0H5S9S1_BRUMA|nr:BMA-DPM-3 [Brugia malayi]